MTTRLRLGRSLRSQPLTRRGHVWFPEVAGHDPSSCTTSDRHANLELCDRWATIGPQAVRPLGACSILEPTARPPAR